MESVKTVGNEFLGIESDLHDTSSSVIIAFPKLKSLSVEGLMELEEWDYGIMGLKEQETSSPTLCHVFLPSKLVWGYGIARRR